jgi:hypothetical protein
MLLKCKRLFHRSRDIASKLLIIIHADKMSIRKKLDNFFSNKTSSFYLNLLLWNPQKQKVTSLCTFNNFNISDTRTNHLFFLPKIPRELQDCFKLTSKQFSFSKCKMFKISKLIMDKDFFTKTKKKRLFEVIIYPNNCQSTLRGNDQYKGVMLYLKWDLISSK